MPRFRAHHHVWAWVVVFTLVRQPATRPPTRWWVCGWVGECLSQGMDGLHRKGRRIVPPLTEKPLQGPLTGEAPDGLRLDKDQGELSLRQDCCRHLGPPSLRGLCRTSAPALSLRQASPAGLGWSVGLLPSGSARRCLTQRPLLASV